MGFKFRKLTLKKNPKNIAWKSKQVQGGKLYC